MKLRRVVWPVVMVCGALLAGPLACEEKPQGEQEAAGAEGKTDSLKEGAAKPGEPVEAASPTPPPPPPPPATPPPAESCTSLINALKAKDDAKVASLSTPTTQQALGAEGAKDHVTQALSNGTCGAAKVEGDTATVAVTAGEAGQDVPFVKAADGWKFDGAAYLAKYPVPEKAAKGKKGKPAHGAKGAAAGHKKHKK